MEHYCHGCSPTEYVPRDQTWTKDGSARPGNWTPYGYNQPIPQDQQESYYATTSQSWTMGGNITPNNSLPVGSYVTGIHPNKSGLPVGDYAQNKYVQNSRPGKEGFCMTGQNYGSLGNSWSGNKPYTLN